MQVCGVEYNGCEEDLEEVRQEVRWHLDVSTGYEESCSPLAQKFIGSQIRRANSKLTQMLSSKMICDIYVVMADCHRQITLVVNKRLRHRQSETTQDQEDEVQERFLRLINVD